MSGFKGKMQRFQRLSKPNEGFALLQLDSERAALFSGEFQAQSAPDFSREQFFAPDFFRSTDKPWFSFTDYEVFPLSELESWAETYSFSKESMKWNEPSYSDFSSQVRKIESGFESHELHKAVPTVYATNDRTDADICFVELLARAILKAGNRQLYALAFKDQGIIGATPEVLFEFSELAEEVQTMALAGTRATENEKAAPLLSDPKELHEHNLVLFDMKEKLNSFGEIKTGETYSWNIGALTHLRTDIQIKISQLMKPDVLFNYLDKTLHPTPALGVASESLNFTWLKDLPGARERYRFGAPIGCWSPDKGAHVLVAIRNIQWTDKEWLLGSGCGYVPESEVDKEWKELELKRASVRALFEVPR